jgi:hypothetical protein
MGIECWVLSLLRE